MVARALWISEALRVVPWLRPCTRLRLASRVSDQGTTLRASDIHNARATILNPFNLGHQMVMVMVMHDLLPRPLCNVNLPSHSEIQLFQNMNFKIHGQGHVCGQRSRSRLTFKIQRSRLWSRSTPLVTFRAWCSIDMFAFPIFVAIVPLLAEI